MKNGLRNAAVVLALISMGWFANDFLRPEIALAGNTVEYKVVFVRLDTEGMESELNKYIKEGWRFHSPWGQGGLIFER